MRTPGRFRRSCGCAAHWWQGAPATALGGLCRAGGGSRGDPQLRAVTVLQPTRLQSLRLPCNYLLRPMVSQSCCGCRFPAGGGEAGACAGRALRGHVQGFCRSLVMAGTVKGARISMLQRSGSETGAGMEEGGKECMCVCVQAALSSPSPSDGGPRQSPVWLGESRRLSPGWEQPPAAGTAEQCCSPGAPLQRLAPRRPTSAASQVPRQPLPSFLQAGDVVPSLQRGLQWCSGRAGWAPAPRTPQAAAASCVGWRAGLDLHLSRSSQRCRGAGRGDGCCVLRPAAAGRGRSRCGRAACGVRTWLEE